MSDFGDWSDDDSFDTAPADPEQVARVLHRMRYERGLETAEFGELTLAQQTLLFAVASALLSWMRRQGAE
jgi:hypothetical protein